MHAPHQLAGLLPQSCGRQRHRLAGSCVALAVRPWAGLPWQAFRFIATPHPPQAHAAAAAPPSRAALRMSRPRSQPAGTPLVCSGRPRP